MNKGLSLEEVSAKQVAPFISATSPASTTVSGNESYQLIRLSEVFEKSSVFVAKAPGISKTQEFMMRSLDIIGSLTIIAITLPLILLVSLLIRASSKGPVLYKQRRIGKNGRDFILYKFRSMVVGAEEGIGPVLAKPKDNRVTKIGKIIRKTRIDELPQLFNVLRGDMSLVGPRPERPFFIAQHVALRGIRLSVRPGITGLAQIRSLYDVKPNHKLKYDYLYIRNRSFLLNLYILAKTIPVVLQKSGW